VLDFVGTDGTLAHAAEVVAPGGAILLVGEARGHLPFGFDAPTIEAWVTTIAWGSNDDLRAVVGLARRGRLRWDVEPMPLPDAALAHERLRAGEVTGRLVLVPERGTSEPVAADSLPDANQRHLGQRQSGS
jgi:propanol-preferring alcohol dehydrogenase